MVNNIGKGVGLSDVKIEVNVGNSYMDIIVR